MAESSSSRSKSGSDTVETASTEDPLVEDRWTNNITYRQLVISSCIGIFQFCYHPYVHDTKRLLPFLTISNICCVTIAYPMLYLELAIAAVSRTGMLKCWDLAPVARGVGFAMLICCMLTTLAASAIGARCLAMLVHSFHSFLPWLHCAAAANPPCAARHRPLPPNALTPPHSFYKCLDDELLRVFWVLYISFRMFSGIAGTGEILVVLRQRLTGDLAHGTDMLGMVDHIQKCNFVLDLKKGLDGGLGNVVWELAFYYMICWLLIYFIAIKRIYSYSKLVLFKDILACFVLLTSALGVLRLDGAANIFYDCDWSTLFEGFAMWRQAVEYALLELSISQGTLCMLGSYAPAFPSLGGTAIWSLLAGKAVCVTSAFILGSTHAALMKDYDGKDTIDTGSSAAIILWADYVARVPGSQFWSVLVFFTLFVLALSTSGLLVQTIMSTFTGHTLRKIRWAFLILLCLLFGLIGTITLCTQGGQYILDFLLTWPVSKPRAPIAATVAAAITYIYGQTKFCEDVYYYVGTPEYPSVLLRISWALSPGLLLGIFIVSMGFWPEKDDLAGWLLVAFTILPITVVILLYLVFKCRVRNIVETEK